MKAYEIDRINELFNRISAPRFQRWLFGVSALLHFEETGRNSLDEPIGPGLVDKMRAELEAEYGEDFVP